ncbi:hypothetical protein BT96DRAFT_426450 [Gymnopus androsaceus JB14]|uniref:Uncharacterized protein n=1 Tax=Gymnopus androsaceus JB14 TaxID=1447944 RepID=A0A6A4I315_9AGAR|nr:hypothetical protein BT96DRAFT_426450 [Gymnopus androsaceus JB14]
MLTKSLSLTIAPHEDDENLETKSASYTHRSFSVDTHLLPLSFPQISLPLARSETLSLSLRHPHARKQSIMDGNHLSYPPNDVSASPTSSTSTTTLAAPTSVPPTPSASTSSFSLALDPIVEVSPLVSAYPYLSPAPTSWVHLHHLLQSSKYLHRHHSNTHHALHIPQIRHFLDKTTARRKLV